MTTYIGYTPNDFLYVQAGTEFPSNCNTIQPPQPSRCEEILTKQYGPDALTPAEQTDIRKCYEQEICENKEKANELIQIQTNHLGSNRRYDDTKQLYWNEMIKTTNLIVGIGGLCFLSFFVI